MRRVLALALLVAAGVARAAPGDFIPGNSTLPGPWVTQQACPFSNPNACWTSGNANTVRDALNDLRTNLKTGANTCVTPTGQTSCIPIPNYFAAPTGDASSAAVTSTGSTTARPEKDRWADVVNVRDFGAKGDGVTDDYAAIMAAINNSRGARNIFFPDSLQPYYVSTTINLKLPVRMYGTGAGWDSTSGPVLQFPKDTPGIVVHRHNTCAGQLTACPSTTGADGSIIEGLRIVGAPSANIHLDPSSVVTFGGTLSTNAATAPDGVSMTASEFIPTAVSTVHGSYKGVWSPVPAGGLFTVSVYMKNAGLQYGLLEGVSGGNRYAIIVDLATGSVVNTAHTGSTAGVSYRVDSSTNGYWRAVLTMTAPTTSATVVWAGMPTSSPTWDAQLDPIYTSDGTSGVYLWGANLDVGSSPTSPTGVVADGIWLRARAEIRDVEVANFSGDGVSVKAASDSNNAPLGNANVWKVIGGRFTGNGGNGLYAGTTDANAGVAINFSSEGNLGWGVYDDSFLSNTYVAGHTSGNGLGAYRGKGSVFIGCYSESGQPASQVSWVFGGLHAAGFDKTAALSNAVFRIDYANGYKTMTNIVGGYRSEDTAPGGATLNMRIGGNGPNRDIFFAERSDLAGTGLRLRWDDDTATGNMGLIWGNGNFRVATIYGPGNTDTSRVQGVTLWDLRVGNSALNREVRMQAASAEPVDGAPWVKGDMAWSTVVAAGGKMGWVCTTAGTAASAWAQGTAYTANALRANGGKVYKQTVTSCTSDVAGAGPSGTGTGFVDSTCRWDYVAAQAVFKQFGAIDP